MTTHKSDKKKLELLTPEARFDLIERLEGIADLNDLLDQFGKEIEKLGIVDGYMINLRDAEAEHLISLKVRFTPEFHFLDETYYRYKVQLTDDTLNVSAKAFLTRGIVQCDAVNGTAIQKQLLTLWKLNEIAAVAILDDDDFSQLPIGTFLILQPEGNIDENVFVILEQLISVFYKPLRNALEASFLKEHKDRFEAAVAEHARLLQFILEMNNLTSSEKIYELFTTELFRLFAFDGMGFFLLEDEVLVNKKVISANERHQAVSAEWGQYLQNKPYVLDTTDGGVSHTFMRNTPLMFNDVQTIINLPMSEKDRQSLAIMKSPRTMLLIPIRYQSKPIGVVVFYSLTGLVPISESDIHLISNLTSFLASAIKNGRA